MWRDWSRQVLLSVWTYGRGLIFIVQTDIGVNSELPLCLVNTWNSLRIPEFVPPNRMEAYMVTGMWLAAFYYHLSSELAKGKVALLKRRCKCLEAQALYLALYCRSLVIANGGVLGRFCRAEAASRSAEDPLLLPQEGCGDWRHPALFKFHPYTLMTNYFAFYFWDYDLRTNKLWTKGRRFTWLIISFPTCLQPGFSGKQKSLLIASSNTRVAYVLSYKNSMLLKNHHLKTVITRETSK